MTVSFNGVRGRTTSSSSHSNDGSITTHFGIAGAESDSSIVRSASSAPEPGTYGSVFAARQSTPPSIAFAYGSISSFAGLKRCPVSGSYGPCTR